MLVELSFAEMGDLKLSDLSQDKKYFKNKKNF